MCMLMSKCTRGSEMDSQGCRSHCALAELAVLNFAMVAQRKGHCKSGWRDAGWQIDCEQHQASSGATDVRVPRWLISAGPLARQHNSCPDWSERSDESEHIGAGRLLSDRREQPEGHQLEGLLFDPREEAGERDPLEFGS